MSKEKQMIEEMAKDLQKSEHWRFNEHSIDFEIDRKKTAENLYNAGYRKQSEGEWKYDEDCECFFCSVCGHSALNNYRMLSTNSNFCPYCGANMKGGE